MADYQKHDFIFEPTPLEGLILIQPKIVEDERGFFMETYNQAIFHQNHIPTEFIQDNHSSSKYGVLRGLHFQRQPMAQAKLVRVTNGAVFDVAVDIRPNSTTFGQWFGVVLSDENRQMLFIPEGFAHGFQVTSESAEFQYKVSRLYSPEHDAGLLWNDPELNIAWPILTDPIISEKDTKHPKLSQLRNL